MSNLVPNSHGGLLPSRRAGQFAKALDRLQDGAGLEIAQVRAAEAVELAKIESIGAAGDTVLRETGRLARVAAFEAASAPHAEGLLQVATVETVAEMVGRVRKLNRRLG